MKKIDNHDKKVAPLNLWDQRNEPGCNCGIKSVCPLEGNCTAGDRVDLAKTEVENKNRVNEKWWGVIDWNC